MLTSDPDINAIIRRAGATLPAGTRDCLVTVTTGGTHPMPAQAWPLHTDIAPACFAELASGEVVHVLLVCEPSAAATALRDTQRLLDHLTAVGAPIAGALWVPRLHGSFPWTDLLSQELRAGIVHTRAHHLTPGENCRADLRSPQRIPMGGDRTEATLDLGGAVGGLYRRAIHRRAGVLLARPAPGPRHPGPERQTSR
ncbi:hypothetical protein [Nocardia tengchongensis]|uniref:hypothetical protein n=1 Tax=Nocardia tengchongensis TaxID=2055889 RepID=UPI00369EDED4